jgi:hypothetical protein
MGPNLALPFPTNSFSSGDLVYVACVVRTPAPQVTLAGNLAPDPAFVSEVNLNYLMIEDRDLLSSDVTAGQIGVNATNVGAAATAPGYVLAMRIPHLPYS